MNVESLVKQLALLPHPEGGYYRETYRSPLVLSADALPPEYGTSRAASTAIYFLLTGDTFSAFHRLRTDECWHYYLGDPVTLHLIDADGRYETRTLGPNLDQEQQPQIVVPAGYCFAAKVERAAGHILLGCTVAPGFEFADFELADRAILTQLCPSQRELIASLTRE